MNKDIAIKVDAVSKTFHEGASARSFKELFVSFGRKITGKKNNAIQKGDFTALEGISFEINKGDFFGIVGRNGSGKSTLLKIIAGVYTPSTGAISINGKLTPFIELGVGFNPELSGKDNVFLNGALLGFTRKQMDSMYEDIVDFAELKDFMDVKLKHYSSGMQVRLAFSVAIRAESDILLIDEVLAVGDIKFQKKCYEYFRSLKENNKTVVFVSHDMGAVKEFCNKAILIDKSEIVKTNNISDALDKYLNLMSPTVEEKTKADKKKEIEIIDSTCDVNNKKIKLTFTFKEIVKHNELFVAFSIKNTNEVLFAYNTARIQNPTSLTISEKMQVEWTFDNILTEGKYYVNFAIVNREGHPIERFEDIMSFNFNGLERSVTAVNPGIEVRQIS